VIAEILAAGQASLEVSLTTAIMGQTGPWRGSPALGCLHAGIELLDRLTARPDKRERQ
jgi:hypothetical protein